MADQSQKVKFRITNGPSKICIYGKRSLPLEQQTVLTFRVIEEIEGSAEKIGIPFDMKAKAVEVMAGSSTELHLRLLYLSPAMTMRMSDIVVYDHVNKTGIMAPRHSRG